MIFFAYLTAFGFYLLITLVALFYVPTRFKEKRQKLAAFLISLTLFVLAPVGWIYYERSYFDRLCEREAGVTIYRTVEGVKGFSADVGFARRNLKRLPYKFIEEKDPAAGLVRYERNEPGDGMLMKKMASVSTPYSLESSAVDLHVTGILRSDLKVYDRTLNELLAVRTTFTRRQNWLKPWLSSGTCREQSSDSDTNFILQVLKTSK